MYVFRRQNDLNELGGGEIVEKLRTKRPHCKIIKDSSLRRFSFFWFKFVLLITQ